MKYVVILGIVLLFIPITYGLPPELPTKYYGRIVEVGGSPVEDIAVTSVWVDQDQKNRSTIVFSLTADQAKDLGDANLRGFYFFNKGQVLAKDGTKIVISAAGSTEIISIDANPGTPPYMIKEKFIIKDKEAARKVTQEKKAPVQEQQTGIRSWFLGLFRPSNLSSVNVSGTVSSEGYSNTTGVLSETEIYQTIKKLNITLNSSNNSTQANSSDNRSNKLFSGYQRDSERTPRSVRDDQKVQRTPNIVSDYTTTETYHVDSWSNIMVSLSELLGFSRARTTILLGILVGILLISILMLCRFGIKKSNEKRKARKNLESVLTTTAMDLMTEDLTTAGSQSLLGAVASLMDKESRNTVFIIEADSIVGSISEWDILKNLDNTALVNEFKAVDIMHTNIIAVQAGFSVYEIAVIMKKNRTRKLPVMHNENVLGIITQNDIVNHLLNTDATEVLVRDWNVPKVKDIMSRSIVYATRKNSTPAALKFMREAKSTYLLVLRKQQPLGIFTSRDFVHLLVNHPNKLVEEKIESNMKSPVFHVEATASIIEAAQMMRVKGCRRLIVMHKEGLVGVITQKMIFLALVDVLSHVTSSKFKQNYG